MSAEQTTDGAAEPVVIYSGEYGTKPDIKSPSVFIQWKGTDACLDFNCKCGEHYHIDASFVYAVKCGACGQLYVMPSTVALKPVDSFDGCIHECTPDHDPDF